MAYIEMPVSPQVLIIGNGEIAGQTADMISRKQPVVRLDQTAGISLVKGQWGGFTVTVDYNEITAGAIVLALEPIPTELTSDCPLPIGERVRPLGQFSSDRLPRDLRSVSFLVGPCETDWHLTFVPALRAALSLAEQGIQVNFFFREYRVAAAGLEEMCHRACLAGVNMCRYQEPPAGRIADSGVELVYREPFLPANAPLMKVAADQLVVAEEYEPNPDAKALAELFGLSPLSPVNVHYRPVKTSRPGIYIIGNSSYPDYGGLEANLIAAETARLAQGKLAIESGYAVVDPARCALCLTCRRVCPHRAVEITGEPNNSLYGLAAWIHPLACQRCGLCTAECPSAAISCEPVPEELAFGGQLADDAVCLQVLACANSGWLTAGQNLTEEISRAAGSDRILIRRVSCAGQVAEGEILRSLLNRADGVLVLPCFDQNCRHRRGNRRMLRRTERIRQLLVDSNLESERFQWRPLSAGSRQQLVEVMAETMDGLRKLGPWRKRRPQS